MYYFQNSHKCTTKDTLALMKDVQEIKSCLENMNHTMETSLKQDSVSVFNIESLTSSATCDIIDV